MNALPPIKALGTLFSIEIFDEDVSPEKLPAFSYIIQLFLKKFESTYSRFIDSSLVSRLNHDRKINNPPREFVELLQLGVTLYNNTSGIFNPLVGETLDARGYNEVYSFQAIPEPIKLPDPNTSLIISAKEIILLSGQIDIGGYGKGYALDAIAAILQAEFQLKYFLINGGGDMYGTSDNGAPITIYLEHPTEEGTFIGTTSIFNNGFATSSPHKRRWQSGNKTYHHIVGPNPSYLLQSDATFVIAASALMADVFGTVALIASKSEMEKFTSLYELGAASFSLPSAISYNKKFAFCKLP